MKTVNIYTDGACRGNPGDGGWGVLIEYENISKEYFGGEKNTTNNKMELKAAIHGLSVLKESCDVNITCLLYTSPSPRDITPSRMPSSA